MKLIISNSSPIPIYEQIKTSIIEQINNNELEENEILPSIRNLAQDIKISVMTIKKSYDELEKHIESAVNIASMYGISKNTIKELVDIFYESGGK